MGQSRLSTVL